MTTTPRKPEKPGQLLFEKIYCISTPSRSDKPDRDYTCTLDQLRWDAFSLGLRCAKDVETPQQGELT